MATSSRYVLLSTSVLLEYVYSDQNVINTPGNAHRKSTSYDSFLKLENGYIKEYVIFNGDNSVSIGSTSGTGNVRDRGFTVVDKNKGKYALLDIDRVVSYNDYDDNLTNTADLPVTFTSGPYSPVYDKIKIHLVQGFNFENKEGFGFELKVKRNDGSYVTLSNLCYNKTDYWETLNSSSFFFGGRVYDSYIEINVPSYYNLNLDYWNGVLTGDSPTEILSEGIGWDRNGSINISFGWVESTETIDDQRYVYIYNRNEIQLPQRDVFETITANVEESKNGDYYEFSLYHNGEIIDDFISDLNNNQGNDYMVLHDIKVYEYIGTGSTNQYPQTGGTWILSQDIELSQVDGFEEPIIFRPVLKNSNVSIAYRIDYIGRLYNRFDNTQIWKFASLISQDVAKYGKKIRKINLGTNPIQSKIYNKNVIKDIRFNNPVTPGIQLKDSYAKYITTFVESNLISLSDTNMYLKIENGVETLVENESSDSQTIAKNGLGKILINQSGTYIKFVVYDNNKSNLLSPVNLSGLGEIEMQFYTGSGDIISIPELVTENASKVSGEVIFRINESNASKILSLKQRNFEIVTKSEGNKISHLYSGKFMDIDEYNSWKEKNEIDKLKVEIDKKKKELNTSKEIDALQEEKIKNLENENASLQSQLKAIQEDFDTTIKTLESNKTKENFKETNDKINKLKAGVKQVKNIKNKKKLDKSTTNQTQLQIDVKTKQSSIQKTKFSPFSPK